MDNKKICKISQSVKPKRRSNKKKVKCASCGKSAHDFTTEEAMSCIPPAHVLQFGSYSIDTLYRSNLYLEHPHYTTEEVVGTFLGHNPYYPGQDERKEDEGCLNSSQESSFEEK
jgi:hypothetical protein